MSKAASASAPATVLLVGPPSQPHPRCRRRPVSIGPTMPPESNHRSRGPLRLPPHPIARQAPSSRQASPPENLTGVAAGGSSQSRRRFLIWGWVIHSNNANAMLDSRVKRSVLRAACLCFQYLKVYSLSFTFLLLFSK